MHGLTKMTKKDGVDESIDRDEKLIRRCELEKPFTMLESDVDPEHASNGEERTNMHGWSLEQWPNTVDQDAIPTTITPNPTLLPTFS